MAKLIWGIDPLAVSPPLLHKLAASARFALISQRAGPLTASPSGEAFFANCPCPLPQPML